MKKITEPVFTLGEKLTDEQLEYFDKHGAIVFRNFVSREQAKLFLSEAHKIEAQWISEGKEKVNGTPLKFGKDENGNTTIQRLCFLSQYSPVLHELLQDTRLSLLTGLLRPYEGR